MTPDERLLTPAEVAERLGLSPQTIGDMLREGDLPGQKIGGRLWRTRAADLDAYIVAGSDAWAEKRAEKRRTGSRAAVGQPPRHDPLPPRLPHKPKAARKAKAAPAPVADPPAEADAADTEPSEAERVAWASLGTDEAENAYTPEYRAWLETQADAGADEGGTP